MTEGDSGYGAPALVLSTGAAGLANVFGDILGFLVHDPDTDMRNYRINLSERAIRSWKMSPAQRWTGLSVTQHLKSGALSAT